MERYFKPEDEGGERCFFGDAMPFWDGERFHVYYLLDRKHHKENRGLGSHRVGHLSTVDLVEWEEHALAIEPGVRRSVGAEHPHPSPLPEGEGAGEVDRHTICTGSVIRKDGVWWFFYATRLLGEDEGFEKLRQVVCVATSRDGVVFEKFAGNPILMAPEGFAVRAFRDPFVFFDPVEGVYHMLVTGARPARVAWRNGVVLRYVSGDLKEWRFDGVAYEPGTGEAPECPELFLWNGWYYMLFSIGGVARYRMGRSVRGPWIVPGGVLGVETLDGPWGNVFRTAEFGAGRRMAVGFVGTREGEKDNGAKLYAGRMVMRELMQREDGTLYAKWVEEMMGGGGKRERVRFEKVCGEVAEVDGWVRVEGRNGLGLARGEMGGSDGELVVRIRAGAGAREFGIAVRCEGALHLERGYWLRVVPGEGRVVMTPLHARLGQENHEAGLFRCSGFWEEEEVEVRVRMDGPIVDVCVNGERCLVNCFPEVRGRGVYAWVLEGGAEFQIFDKSDRI